MVYGKLWVSALPDILGCDHSKETSLAVCIFFNLKKKWWKKGLKMLLKFDFEPLGMQEYNLLINSVICKEHRHMGML